MSTNAPVSESRKKTFAWTNLLTSVGVDGFIAPLSRLRTLWVAAPTMVQAGVATFGADTITYTGIAAVAARKGYSELWLPAAVMAGISLLKQTKCCAKVVEKPMKLVQKTMNPEDDDGKLVRFLKIVGGPTLSASIVMLVEYPFQVVMYRMASDTQSSGFLDALTRALGMADGAGLAGLQTLYLGYDVTVYGVLGGSVLMALAETSGIKALGMPSQGLAGLLSLVSDGLALRMVCSQTWSPLVALANANQVEGMFWPARGLPFLFAENIAPIFLNALRARVVNMIFADVIKESEDAQQRQMQAMMAQFKAMEEAQKAARGGGGGGGGGASQVEEVEEDDERAPLLRKDKDV